MTARISNQHLESALDQFFVKRVRILGGHTIKLAPTEVGVPDRLVFMPGGGVYLVELKAPTGSLRPAQVVWHNRIGRLGTKVYILQGRQHVIDWLRDVMDKAERDIKIQARVTKAENARAARELAKQGKAS